MPTRMRFGFIGLVMSLLMIGYGCGGSGGNTNGQENSSPPDGDIANNREAAEALMGMADAEMYAYASLLEMFSDGGTKPLFDSSVDLTDADYETLMDLSDRIEAAVPAYEAAGVFLTQHSTPNSRVRYVQGHPRLPQGVIGAIGDFVSWMRGATGERRRNDILQIAAQLSEAERQQMYQSAQDSLPGQDIGGNANEFFEKLTNGDLDHSAARLHNDYVHNIDIPAYGNKAQDLSARPIDIAAREGAKGVEAGAQVIAEGSKAIICAKFPQFCEGVDKAQEIVDKLNEIGEDPVGAAGDTVNVVWATLAWNTKKIVHLHRQKEEKQTLREMKRAA